MTSGSVDLGATFGTGGGGGGVSSLNTMTGALTLVAGSGITITPGPGTLTISTAMAGSVTSINGDSTAAQTLTVGTTGTDFAIVDNGFGDHKFNLPTASAVNRGALSSADWSTFNAKQPAGSYITALTGDGTAAGPGSAVFTLATVATPGTFPKITFNAKGLVTSGSALSSGDIPNNAANTTGTASNVTGVVAIANGGTGQTTANAAFNALSPLTTAGDLLTFTTVNARLGIGTAGQVLTVVSGAPAWQTVAGTGTVTSVALADSTGTFSITGSPVTSSGTLTLNAFNSQAAKTFLAAPNGGAGAPSFRLIVASDIPTLNQNTTGTASNITATSNSTLTTLSALTTASSLSSVGTITSGTWNGTTIAIANGGTGQTTANAAFNALSPLTTAGDLLTFTTVNARLGIGTTGQVLTVVGGAPAWAAPATSGTVTSVALADGSTAPIYTISGSPVTSSGTLTFTLAAQAKNTIFAGPASGANAQPTFRTQVLADLPQMTNGQVYVGSTGASVVATTLTAGTGISITNGAGSITISSNATTTFLLKSSNYTILSTDSTIGVDTTSGSFTLTLPSPAGLAGKIYRIIDTEGTLSTNNLTLARSASEEISGLAANKVFSTDWGFWTVTTDGTDWYVG
jgi:trimeric autotransporter adhesin